MQIPSEDTWTALFRALDPMRPLPLGEPLREQFVEPEYSPVRKVGAVLAGWERAARSGEAGAPPKILFCGARGSGKSTHLRRMVLDLRENWQVVFADLAPVLPPRIATVQLVAHIGLLLLAELSLWAPEASRKAEVDEAARDSGFQESLARFADALGPLDELVEAALPLLVTASIAGPQAVAAAAGVKAGASVLGRAWDLSARLLPLKKLSLSKKLAGRLGGDQERDAQDLVGSVNQLARTLSAKTEKRVFVALDGLDRMRSAEEATAAFDDVELLGDLDLALAISGPTSLRHDPRFASLRTDIVVTPLFNFPVVTRDGEPDERGILAMRSLVEKRLGAKLFPLLDEDALRLAIRSSSGNPRELLGILRDAQGHAERDGRATVSLAQVERACKEIRLTIQQPINRADYALLGQVLESQQPGPSPRDGELLYANLIVCYPNENSWCRPNELLVPGIRQHIQLERRLTQARDRENE